MANAIGRLRITGIAYQSTFGTPATAPQFSLPVQDTSFFVAEVMKEENSAATGSDYAIDGVTNGGRFGTFSNTIKINENILPLFFLQKYTDVATDNSDSTYTHTLSYALGTQSYVTVFMQDDNRTDYRMSDVLFSNLTAEMATTGFVTLAFDATGRYPEAGDFTVAYSQVGDFVGRHATFSSADFGSAVADAKLRSATLTHTFNLSPEDDNLVIGSQDIDFHQINSTRFEISVNGKMSDRSDYDDFTGNQSKVLQATIEDTNREIGSGTQNPSIQFDYPLAKPLSYSDEGGLDDNLNFSSTYVALDTGASADMPMKLTVTNTVADYTA